jgi:hypothetical protein
MPISEAARRLERLDVTLDAIRDRFGRGTIHPGLNRRPRVNASSTAVYRPTYTL